MEEKLCVEKIRISTNRPLALLKQNLAMSTDRVEWLHTFSLIQDSAEIPSVHVVAPCGLAGNSPILADLNVVRVFGVIGWRLVLGTSHITEDRSSFGAVLVECLLFGSRSTARKCKGDKNEKTHENQEPVRAGEGENRQPDQKEESNQTKCEHILLLVKELLHF